MGKELAIWKRDEHEPNQDWYIDILLLRLVIVDVQGIYISTKIFMRQNHLQDFDLV
jgi:hypothetical protein